MTKENQKLIKDMLKHANAEILRLRDRVKQHEGINCETALSYMRAENAYHQEVLTYICNNFPEVKKEIENLLLPTAELIHKKDMQ